MNDDVRIIKKYPNRRLYDTAISSYITLERIKALVLEHTEFKVIDARTQEDITHTTLLQIISEQEDQGSPIFTNQVLQYLIRIYGDSMQGMMSRFLEQSMSFFINQQDVMKSRMDTILKPPELSNINDYVQQNMAAWKSMQDNFMTILTQQPTSPPTDAVPEATPQTSEKETEPEI